MHMSPIVIVLRRLTIFIQTENNAQGNSVTTLWRAIRANKEDRVAKLEWASNGGLGRAVIGKVSSSSSLSLESFLAHRRHLEHTSYVRPCSPST